MDLAHTQTLRLRVFQGLCLALALATFGVALANLFISANYMLAGLELVFSAGSLALFQYSRTHQDIGLWRFAYVNAAVSLAVIAVFAKPVSEAIFAWFLFFPLVHYVILGRHQGAIATGLTLAAAVVTLILHPINTLPLSLLLINLVLAYLCIWVLAHVYEANREKSAQLLSDMALHDALTGCYNRHALSQSYREYRGALEGSGEPFALLVADLDHFKQINDRFGHDTGDEMLRQSGALMRRVFSDNGEVFRIGGEEFCILLTCNTEEQALNQAERLRQGFDHHAFVHQGRVISLSVSIGVALVTQADDLQQLLNRADKHLYQAKNLGRNRVMLAS
ncbi:GGDEF domain-containing protein [Ferrimonas sp. YFM]|uniref:GGDEF domain-containing protein n=1 Tax=Ferrimonas sp. YFM TaxID=3028878 RepID=UPI002572DB62|nr:GGDEF domain-containing protein [Ferrimonas sp. YFM]BDY05117.1 GGDEF domain-containing protein [Ferrimonas sp. YFM]